MALVDLIKEISKIVSRMKNKNSAGLDKVFSKMVKHGLEIAQQTIVKIPLQPSARLQKTMQKWNNFMKYYVNVIFDLYHSLQKMKQM